jgi:hypothetical protein
MGMDIEHFESHNETLDGALKWSSYVGGIVMMWETVRSGKLETT